MKKINFNMKLLKNYYKPTPKKWRVIGDTLLAISSLVTAGGLFAYDMLKEVYTPSELKLIIGSAFAFGVTGKFLTNFFKEDEKN